MKTKRWESAPGTGGACQEKGDKQPCSAGAAAP